ncbi:hypothetical protein ZEAMMB73_Zm00001d044354 [Zea mays]|uniref:Uncharacterized protein n=1 Tax=Zea mays TaxID=4577 RepID=A0A1D6NL52_MAIZE|nr:hypothetical protein ZEAMMB73_Zm00001d044354 [Zea mays]
MDASQDVWDWVVLPEHRRFYMSHGSKNLDGKDRLLFHAIRSPDTKESATAADNFAQEEVEEGIKKDDYDDKTWPQPQCPVFSVGKLKVNVIRAVLVWGSSRHRLHISHWRQAASSPPAAAENPAAVLRR